MAIKIGQARLPNTIRLSHYDHANRELGGVKTEINGVEMQEVGNIQLDCPVDGYPVLRIAQNITGELDVTLNGVVEPTLNMFDESLMLVVEHVDQATTRYHVVRKAPAAGPFTDVTWSMEGKDETLMEELLERALSCPVLHHMFNYIRIQHLPEREMMLRTLLFFSKERSRLLAEGARLLSLIPGNLKT